MRAAYSLPSLSDTTSSADPDRADGDWRQGRPTGEDNYDKPPRSRSLLNDFQGMRM